MLALMATEFVCDPVCRYDDNIDNKAGASPLILRDGDGEQGTRYFTEPDRNLTDLDVTPETRFSVFVWASDEQTGVLFQQPFEAFITASYHLPLPKEWSFAAGDEKPF